MKRSFTILCFNLLITSSLFVSGCNNSNYQNLCTINFYVENTIYETKKINKGEKLSYIEAPKIENKEFKYWTLDLNSNTEFNFNTIVENDLNLYAYYVDSDSNYIKLEQDDIRFTYDDVYKSQYTGVIPSIGNPNIIVVPVEFSDQTSYKFNSKNLNTLNALFNGNKEDNTNDYSESVRSFYKKSSYGLLDINFIISDVYKPTITSRSFVSYENREDGGGTYKLIEEFYNKGTINDKKINFNDSIYDLNNDKYVDGIWFVYNNISEYDAQNYWPYVYWYYGDDATINISAYGNCSAYFMYEDSSIGQDYHTFVHETGHMLGLNDYYNSSIDSQIGACGGLDMMDQNIGDHDAFSKFSLGWTSPYIVKDECEITLKPFSTTGESIIVGNEFNNSAFSEYFIIEYYTPTNLNELDSTNKYPNRTLYYSKNGVRIFHIDARLGKFSNEYNSSFMNEFLNVEATSIPSLLDTNNRYFYNPVGDNSLNYSYDGKTPLIELVTKGNTPLNNKRVANDNDLFHVGDVFNKVNQSNFFNKGLFNNGTSFDYNVSIIEMNDSFVRIKFSK